MLIPKDILSAAQQVRRAILKQNGGVSHNMCDIASSRLCKRLKMLGYRPKYVEGLFDNECHCWVRVLSHILDVTADQFGDFPTVLWEKTDKHYKGEACAIL